MNLSGKTVSLTLLISLTILGAGTAQEVFVIKTSDIIPYNICIEGLQERLSAHTIQIANMEGDLEKGRDQLNAVKDKKDVQVIIAVGPQAAFILAEFTHKAAKLFCMVLNPEKVIPAEKRYPGVSINIPGGYQLHHIKRAFPDRKRIGVFFTLPDNKPVVESLQHEASLLGLDIVGFPITAAADIFPAIASKNFTPDVLLMVPDEKINSQKIVEYIIKEALRRKIPVIGYNSWFAKNGAIMSFIIDYRAVGVQTGAIAEQLLKNAGADARQHVESPAHIRVSIDVKTAEKLGIKISPDSIQQAHEVIH